MSNAVVAKKDTLYNVVNAGKTRPYQITGSNSKHFRHELVDGRVQLVAYCGPGSGYPNARNVIELLPSDAETKYAHMGLKPVQRGSASEIVATEIKTSSAEDQTEALDIPADWSDHSEDQILAWAQLISGKNIRSINRANQIIEGYLADGKTNSD